MKVICAGSARSVPGGPKRIFLAICLKKHIEVRYAKINSDARREADFTLRHGPCAEPGRDGAGDELLRAVADEHTHLVQRARGVAEGGERMVDTGMQIGQRVKERPVQIKNCKLIHGSILSFGVI